MKASHVRFELAPELTSSSAGVEGNNNNAPRSSAAMQLTIVGWALDTFSMPGLHLDDRLVAACNGGIHRGLHAAVHGLD